MNLFTFVYFNTGNIFDMEKQRQLELQREQIENEELRRRGEEELKKQQELGVSPYMFKRRFRTNFPLSPISRHFVFLGKNWGSKKLWEKKIVEKKLGVNQHFFEPV